MPIERGEGNLLTADVEALVDTVNTEGVMGKGLTNLACVWIEELADKAEVNLGDFTRKRLHMEHHRFGAGTFGLLEPVNQPFDSRKTASEVFYFCTQTVIDSGRPRAFLHHLRDLFAPWLHARDLLLRGTRLPNLSVHRLT